MNVLASAVSLGRRRARAQKGRRGRGVRRDETLKPVILPLWTAVMRRGGAVVRRCRFHDAALGAAAKTGPSCLDQRPSRAHNCPPKRPTLSVLACRCTVVCRPETRRLVSAVSTVFANGTAAFLQRGLQRGGHAASTGRSARPTERPTPVTAEPWRPGADLACSHARRAVRLNSRRPSSARRPTTAPGAPPLAPPKRPCALRSPSFRDSPETFLKHCLLPLAAAPAPISILPGLFHPPVHFMLPAFSLSKPSLSAIGP